MADLDTIIEDSITDVELPQEEPDLAIENDDVSAEAIEPVGTTEEVVAPVVEDKPAEVVATTEVTSPATKTADKPVVDDFDKKYGLQKDSASGRENRIPYSRVRKIVTKAETVAREAVTKEWQPRFTTMETKVKELEPKVADYEARLIKVGEFESTMINRPIDHLNTLIKNIPAYAQILAPLLNQDAPQKAEDAPETTNTQPVGEAMPQPDQKLSDGSMVYSMDGLSKLMEWHGKQVESRVTKQVEARYAPMETQFQSHQRMQSLIPKVQSQIDAARKWERFTENEVDIVKALQADQSLTLEGAYQQVVFPKFKAEAEAAKVDKTQLEREIRAQVIKELKQTPRSTSTAAAQTKAAPVTAGPRSIEDIIAEQIKTLSK